MGKEKVVAVSWGWSAHKLDCVRCCACPFIPMEAAESRMAPGASATMLWLSHLAQILFIGILAAKDWV